MQVKKNKKKTEISISFFLEKNGKLGRWIPNLTNKKTGLDVCSTLLNLVETKYVHHTAFLDHISIVVIITVESQHVARFTDKGHIVMA